jgi:hypothetical protein
LSFTQGIDLTRTKQDHRTAAFLKTANMANDSSSSMQSHLQRLQEIMAQSASRPIPNPQHSSPPKQVQSIPPQRKVDVSSITEWAPGLKHVTRLMAQNPQLEVSIRKVSPDYMYWKCGCRKLTFRQMISEHRAHEEQWLVFPAI